MPPDLAKLSVQAQRQLGRELTRRSLGRFHAAAFSMLHPGDVLFPGPHIDAMVHVLEQIALGTITRLVINVPPRHGKSELVSGAFPAWVLGNDPQAKVTIVSYGSELSEPLVDNSRTILNDAAYARLFPETRIRRGRDRKELLQLTAGGTLRAASKGGSMTGHGTHFLIADDFHKAGETQSPVERERALSIFRSTFVNRFENLNDSRIIIVMQRIHEDDLSGWALAQGGWHHLCLPAIAVQDQSIPLGRGKIWVRKKGDVLAPAIASRTFLEEQRLMMGPPNFEPQFQQNPIAGEGGIINFDWFGQYEEQPRRTFFHKIVQSLDLASTDRITSDYSVGQTWGFRDDEWYLLDVFRRKIAFTELTELAFMWHRKWRADALIIENASIGNALYDLAKRKPLPGILRCPTPRLSKADRVANCTVQLQSGKFLLPASADWLADFRHEMIAFPGGGNDDHVDALTQFIEFAFLEDRWVRDRYDADGRLIRAPRPPRPPRYYGGHQPSAGSWRNDD